MSVNQSTSPLIAGAAVTQTSALLQKMLAIIFETLAK
jgi:hypothetical protein